jgi:alkylation response protein AidB-like acyl-CoA dehydrogenase
VQSVSARSFSDPEALAFRSTVRDWVARSIPKEWAAARRGSLSQPAEIAIRRQWDRLLADSGYACITWPIEYGGRAVGPIEELIFYEETAAANAPEELGLIGKYTAGPAIILHGTPEQRARYLPRILQGSEIWCEGFSEPNAGSDLAAVTTTATKTGTKYRLEGRKIWTSFAEQADRCYLLVRTSLSAARHHNLSVMLVDMHQSGITVRAIRQITGAEGFCEVLFDGATAAATDLLGDENDGWRLVSLKGIRTERGIADQARRLIQMTSAIAQLRECCGEMGQGSDVLDTLSTRLDLFRWHLLRTTELRAAGQDWLTPRSITKLYWTELWQEITAAGVSTGCPNHEPYWRYRYLEARPATVYGGSAEIQRNVIADRTLRLPR